MHKPLGFSVDRASPTTCPPADARHGCRGRPARAASSLADQRTTGETLHRFPSVHACRPARHHARPTRAAPARPLTTSELASELVSEESGHIAAAATAAAATTATRFLRAFGGIMIDFRARRVFAFGPSVAGVARPPAGAVTARGAGAAGAESRARFAGAVAEAEGAAGAAGAACTSAKRAAGAAGAAGAPRFGALAPPVT